MKKEQKTAIILASFFLVAFAIGGLSSIALISSSSPASAEQVTVGGVEGTGSMLPTITPDSQLIYMNFGFEERPLCGNMYVYTMNDENKSYDIIHRFVYENQRGELYFKGDNNRIYDKPISRDQILRRVIGVNWGEDYGQ